MFGASSGGWRPGRGSHRKVSSSIMSLGDKILLEKRDLTQHTPIPP